MFGSSKNKKRVKSERATSSEVWREFRFPKLMQVLKEKLHLEEIDKMYSLVFFWATDKNIADAISYVDEKKYKKLSEMTGRVPLDFDEKDYQTCDVVYIIGHNAHYIALIWDDEQKKSILLKYFTETSPINLELFLGRGLIYPI
jgi:hypothetical protein